MKIETAVTEEGYLMLKETLDNLTSVKKKELIDEIKKAREDNHCAISENSAFMDATAALERTEKQISDLRCRLASSRVIKMDALVNDGVVKFGCTVTILNLEDKKESVYKLVGVDESDVRGGKISYQSLLAKELIGCVVGDYVDCAEREYEILKVEIITNK